MIAVALEPKDRTLLLKLLGMTGSAHDGEALNAMRMATALMVKCKVTWAELLGAAGSEMRGQRPQQRRQESNPGGSDFWDRYEQHRQSQQSGERASFEEALRRWSREMHGSVDLGRLWAEAMRAGGFNPDAAPDFTWPGSDGSTRTDHRTAMDEEKKSIAFARLRLDEILKRKRMDALKRQHFESIRAQHQRTGHINVAHRSQIDRAYYSQGWDEPLGPDK